MDKSLITLIGIGVTFLVGIINLLITFRNARKSTYITSVTSSRIEYIQNIRSSISDLCAIANSNKSFISEDKPENWGDLKLDFETKKHLTKFYLNPEDEYWDSKIIELIDKINIFENDITLSDFEKNLKELILITQYLLKLEWEGAKKESEEGVLSKFDKQIIYKKYEGLHKTAQEKNE